MKLRIIRYLKHIFITLITLLLIGIIIVVSLHGSIGYGTNELSTNLQNEGPYVFYQNDSIVNVNYIKGNKTNGFYLNKEEYKTDVDIKASSFFPLDSTSFQFTISPNIEIPKSVYDDGEPILAISDIESGYKTFRDFLIENKVINENLNWSFGKGHLVLVGDFVDRGYSTTNVLWFIYKLEQDAKNYGGHVHFILGNHELYNMQGKYQSASHKYYSVASILGKQHHNLFDQQSFIGRWMASKNTIERINGNLFVHGGIHPEIADYDVSIEQVNQLNRKNYYHSYFPKPEKNLEQLIISTKKGISWYRGYFKDDLTQEDVEVGLHKFKAKAVIVGHTIQWKPKKYFNGKVIAIDVKHPKDYNKNWPSKNSEGLYINDHIYYRAKADGTRIQL